MRCRLCKMPLSPTRVRRCRRCNLIIARHDKYIHVTVRGKTMLEHRDCSAPDVYPGATPG